MLHVVRVFVSWNNYFLKILFQGFVCVCVCIPYTCLLGCSIKCVSYNEFDVKNVSEMVSLYRKNCILTETMMLNLVVFMEGLILWDFYFRIKNI